MDRLTVVVPVGTKLTFSGKDDKGSFDTTIELTKPLTVTLKGGCDAAIAETVYHNEKPK